MGGARHPGRESERGGLRGDGVGPTSRDLVGRGVVGEGAVDVGHVVALPSQVGARRRRAGATNASLCVAAATNTRIESHIEKVPSAPAVFACVR